MSGRPLLIQAGGWVSHHGPVGTRLRSRQLQARLQPAFHEHQEEMTKRFPTIPSAIRRQFLEMAIRVAMVLVAIRVSANLLLGRCGIVLGGGGRYICSFACANVASLARSLDRPLHGDVDAHRAGCFPKPLSASTCDGKPDAFGISRRIRLADGASSGT